MRLEIALRGIMFHKQSGEKGFGQGDDQELDGHSDRAPGFLCGDGRNFQKYLLIRCRTEEPIKEKKECLQLWNVLMLI